MNGDRPRSLLPRSRPERNCAGLRTYESSSLAKVYKANPDGTAGELPRIEKAIDFDHGYPRLFLKTADKTRGV